jgi:hypothetical protein
MKTIIITESQLQIIVEMEKMGKFKHSSKKKAKRVADKDIAQYFKKPGDPWGTDVNPSEKWPRHTIPYDTKFDFDELNEMYDSEKMYAKSYVEDRLKKAPRYIKKYMKELDEFEKDGRIFVKIPQVLYQYLFGNF